MTTLTTQTLTDALYDAGLDEDAISEDYSGRGMYGETCLGITVDSVTEALQVAAHLGPDYADLWRRARTDSMGRGLIVYFPGVKLVAADGEE